MYSHEARYSRELLESCISACSACTVFLEQAPTVNSMGMHPASHIIAGYLTAVCRQGQLVWHARIKPPPASRDRLESRQSRQTVADTAGRFRTALLKLELLPRSMQQ